LLSGGQTTDTGVDYANVRSDRSFLTSGALQPLYAERLQHVALVYGFARRVPHLVQEVLLERDLRKVHPLALLRPRHVARRHLRQGDESDARISHVGQADRVPGRGCGGRLTVELGRDVADDRRNHRLDHIAGLRRAGRNGRLFDGRDRNAYSSRVDVRITRAALMLVDQDEAARVDESLDVAHGGDAAKRGQEHREALLDPLRFDRVASLVMDGERDAVRVHGVDLRVRDPLDVVLAELGLEQALRIADAAE